MDVLLSEHAYLYENACEVEYFVENKITDAGKNLVAKAQAAIENVRKIIADLWNKLVDWVTTKVTEIKKKIASKFGKKEVIHNFEVIEKEDNAKADAIVLALPNKSSGNAPLALEDKSRSGSNAWVFGVNFSQFIQEAYINDMNADPSKAYDAIGQYYNEKKNASKIPSTNEVVEIATAAIFTSNDIIKQIKQAQKFADQELFKMERNMKDDLFGNTKDTGDEFKKEYNDIMTKFRKFLNSNTVVCKDKVKIFTELVNESMKIVIKLGSYKAA